MYTLLLVDDEADILDNLERAIAWAQFGFTTIRRATRAADALRLLAQIPIDMIITDIRMPDMDGLSMLRRIRDMQLNTLTVVISSHSDFELVRQSLRLDAHNYLLKPIDVQELSATAREAATLLRTTRAYSRDAFRQSIIRRWLQGTISATELDERSQYVGVNPFFKSYTVVLLKTEPLDQVLAARLTSALSSYGAVYAVRADEETHALILGGNSAPGADLTDAVAHALRSEPIAFAIGDAVDRSEALCQSYRGALDRLTAPPPSAVSPLTGAPFSPIVDAAIGYIQTDYLKSITLKHFCTRMHANSSYIGQLFRAETGLHFTEYVAQVRIEHAVRMLSQTELSVQDIAAAAGFNSSGTMIQTFNKYLGMSPRQYRLAERARRALAPAQSPKIAK